MNYCILIELSRRTIAFSYSRDDGKNQFVPYGDELVKPLAIYSLGNELRIGKFAAEEARSGKAGAYDNIFDAIKKPASFTYRGTQYPLNKLLLFGIEQCLREFFDSILYGIEGQLEQNTAKVPICLLMSSELTDNEQAYVINLLRNAGYSNTNFIDYNTMVLGHIKKELAKNIEKAVFVSNVGNDLFIECIDAQEIQQPKRLFDLSEKNAGRNPQIDQLVKLIWQDIQYDENSMNLVFDECLPELQNQAQSFLDSGDLMCQNAILFNGHSYEYFLSRNSIAGRRHGTDNALDNLLLQLKSKGVEPTKSSIILLRSTANNAYVKQSFSESFPSVIIFDEKKHQEMLSSILESVKERSYILNDNVPSSAPSIADIVICPSNTQVKKPEISFTLKRTVKVKIADINAKIRNKDRKGAKRIVEQLLSDLHEQNVHDWDVEINSLLTNMPISDEKTDQQPEEKPQEEPEEGLKEVEKVIPKVDSKRYQREVRLGIAEIKGKIRIKDYISAESILNSLQSKLHKDGVYEYDRQFEEVKKEIVIPPKKAVTKTQVDSPKPKVEKNTAKSLSPAEKLLKEGKFADAKRAYASEGNSKMAQVCSDFIKSKRVIEQYKMGLDAVKRNKNRTTVSNALRDLEKYQKLYKEYGVDSNELVTIINNYKSI